MPATGMLLRAAEVQTPTDELPLVKKNPHWNLKIESKHHNKQQII